MSLDFCMLGEECAVILRDYVVSSIIINFSHILDFFLDITTLGDITENRGPVKHDDSAGVSISHGRSNK